MVAYRIPRALACMEFMPKIQDIYYNVNLACSFCVHFVVYVITELLKKCLVGFLN